MNLSNTGVLNRRPTCMLPRPLPCKADEAVSLSTTKHTHQSALSSSPYPCASTSAGPHSWPASATSSASCRRPINNRRCRHNTQHTARHSGAAAYQICDIPRRQPCLSSMSTKGHSHSTATILLSATHPKRPQLRFNTHSQPFVTQALAHQGNTRTHRHTPASPLQWPAAPCQAPACSECAAH